MTEGTPKLYDIRKVLVYVDGALLRDIGDGIGITPKKEAKTIMTAYGEVGFSLDPSTAAEVTINLLATSPDNQKLSDMASANPPVPHTVKITAPAADKLTYGFEEIGCDYVIIHAGEKSVAGEAPTFTYKGVGYGYHEK